LTSRNPHFSITLPSHAAFAASSAFGSSSFDSSTVIGFVSSESIFAGIRATSV
jgi:hypothetical protein